MIQTDTLIVNSKLVTAYVLTFYDGIKEEVDIKNSTIYLWYDEQENFEIWLKIKAISPRCISDYLRNSVGILDVIKSSSLELLKRSYSSYKELHKHSQLGELDEIELPENEMLGQDFLTIMHEGRKVKTTFLSDKLSSTAANNVAFKQVYHGKMVETKTTSANDANIQLFDTMAA